MFAPIAMPVPSSPVSRVRRVDAHDDGINAWTMVRCTPPVALAGLIDGYCDYAERTGSFTCRRELPHAGGVLMVNLADPISLTGGDGRVVRLNAGEAFIAGTHLRPALSCSTGRQAGVEINLPLSTLRRLLGTPMTLFLDRVVPLADLLGADARALCQALGEASHMGARIACLDEALRRHLMAAPALDPRQLGALELLGSRPDLDITAVAGLVGWSRKHLADRTRDALGVGPRTFRRLLRFQHATRILAGQPRPDWATMALDAGYCDQSHLIRDFREFAGLTPSAFAARSLANSGGLVEY